MVRLLLPQYVRVARQGDPASCISPGVSMKPVHALLIALSLGLPLCVLHAQELSVTFANQRYVKQQEDTKPGDVFVSFGLAGETEKNWTKRFLFHSFPDSGDDVAKGVGSMIKWIKQRDNNVPIGVLKKDGSKEIIVDFLLPPGAGDWFQFNVLRYTTAADGEGLVAAHYLFRFETGELDGNELKTLRRAAIDAMAHFDMQPIQAYFRKQP